MRNSYFFLLITILTGAVMSAQVKIGDNPQNIDPSSVLELESTDKVLVITRVTTAQMNAIVPIQGALCFNTDLQSVHYYNGTQWVNIGGGGTGGPLTADPIVNMPLSTIVITPTATGNNLEVAPESLSGEQIKDGSITGTELTDGSIGPGKLQDQSVTIDKLSENSVGAFALDNDSFGVSAFNNDVGYLTAADLNLVSGDVGNVLENRVDGVFYNDQPLINAINQNTDAIALDDDQSATNELQNLSIAGQQLTISDGNTITLPAGTTADGSETKVSAGTNVTVTGDGTTATPYVINSTGGGGTGGASDLNFDETTNILTLSNPATAGNEVDLSSLAGGGTGTDNQNLGPATLNATSNILTIEIEDGNETTVDLSPLTGSSGDDNQTAAEVPFTASGNTTSTDVQAAIVELQTEINGITAGGEVNTASNAGTGGVGLVLPKNVSDLPFKSINTGLSGIITVTDDTDEKEVELDIAENSITANKLNRMGATDGQILVWKADDVDVDPEVGSWMPGTDMTGTGTITDTDVNDGLSDFDSDTGYNLNVDNTTIEVESDNLQVKDEGITADKLNRMGATDGQILVWKADDIDVDPLVGSWAASENAAHTGVTKSIFFAGADGLPRQFFNPDNNEPSFYWDYEGRQAAGNSYGTLAIGLDGGVISNDVKVHIAEQLTGANQVSYGLMLQNRAGGIGNGTGILFSVDDFTTTFGKGALVFERTDAAWQVGDFHFLQNAIADATGLNNPVLATDKAFTITSNKDIRLYGNLIDKNGIGIKPPLTANEVGWVLTNTATGTQWAPSGGASGTVAGSIFFAGPSPNFTPIENPAQLFWDNATNRLGIGINTPTAQLQVANQVRAGSFSGPNLGGSATNPTYRFNSTTKNDGMFQPLDDEIAFSTGGIEALRIDENQKVGVGTTSPTSTLHTGGSFSANIRSDGGVTVDLEDDDYTVILSGATTVNIPTPNADNLGRIYILKNATAAIINIPGYIPSNGSNDLGAGNVLQIQSDGTNWYQIN